MGTLAGEVTAKVAVQWEYGGINIITQQCPRRPDAGERIGEYAKRLSFTRLIALVIGRRTVYDH